MNLVNITGIGKDIYLFIRDGENLKILKDDSYYPFCFRRDDNGNYKTIDGYFAKKIYVSHPKDVNNISIEESYQADIRHDRYYMLEKVDKIDKCDIKKGYWDIEVCGEKFAKPYNPVNKVSCITVLDNPNKKITFDIRDFHGKEKKLFDAFLGYLSQEQYDLLYNWNIHYDYPYLWWRSKMLFGQRFNIAKIISPINYTRYAEFGDFINKKEQILFREIQFPAGISMIDLMQLFKKITLNKRASYALDFIAQEDLGEESWGTEDFTAMTDHVKDKNIHDCERMWLLDQKFNITETFDYCRRQTKLQFEDLYYNLRIHDQRMLMLAKKKGLILKSKQKNNKERFEGAYRHAKTTGIMFGISCYDLSGAYLYAVIDFCLDECNITDENDREAIKIAITDRITNEVKEWCYIKQNLNAMLPLLAKDTIEEKNIYKEKLTNTKPEDSDYKQIEEEYAFRKSLALSLWGIIGNRYFRGFNAKIASLITSIVRDCLHYVEDEIIKRGYDVVFTDTDSIFCDTKGENIVDLLNQFVQEWSMKKFGKYTKIVFDFEGIFKDIFIFSRCRYEGTIVKDGIEKLKTKGIEAKRADASAYIKEFQTKFLLKLRNKESKDQIIVWIKNELAALHDNPIINLSFPAKINKDESDYKSIPIFFRAYLNSQLTIRQGVQFFWCYVLPYQCGTQQITNYYFNGIKLAEKTAVLSNKKALAGENIIYRRKEYTAREWLNGIKEEKLTKPKMSNVAAFTKDNIDILKDKTVDIKEMARRNILNKCRVMFKALGWDMGLIGGINLSDMEYEKMFKDETEEEEEA